MPDSENLLRLLSGDLFPGIGVRTAGRLVNTFGEGLYDILRSGNKGPLAAELTAKKTQALLDGWARASARQELVRWLDQHGIDPQLGEIVFRLWGANSLEKLSQNPFRLLSMTDWKAVDRLARRIGISVCHPIRLVGAAEAAAYKCISESGSTWVSTDDLLKDMIDLLQLDDKLYDAKEQASSGMRIAVETKALLPVDSGFQVPGAFFAEREVETWITRRLGDAAYGEAPSAGTQDLAIEGLTREQTQAVWNALRYPISVFFGPGGTGKTFTVRQICNRAEGRGKKIILLALAAKAVRKLQSSTGRPAMTLARALHRLRATDFQNALVVVDEFSMVDLLDFRQLIRKLPHDVHLVLCGDSAQLPSIGPGRLLHSFVSSAVIPRQELTTIHRQAHETGIPEKLSAIRRGRLPTLPVYDWMAPDHQGLYTLPCSPTTAPSQLLRLLKAYPNKAQAISPLLKTPLGAHSLNRFVHRRLTGAEIWGEGTPVVFTANSILASGDEVVNGLQGTVHSVLARNPVHPDTPYLVVETDHGHIACSLKEVRSRLDLSYVLTVHRAQGSDWDTVIVVLPRCRILERSMLYTAVSRCRQRCILLAPDVDALKEATASRPAYELREDRLFASRIQTAVSAGNAPHGWN